MASKAELQAILDCDNKPFIRAMSEAVRKAKHSGKQIEGVWSKANKSFGGKAGGLFAGAIGVGALAAGARGIANVASEVNDMSDSIGMGTEQFQRWSFAFTQAGAAEKDFVKGMATLISKLEEAKGGNKEAIAQFENLGISLGDLDKIQADEALLRISDALKRSQGDARTTAAVIDLLGNKVALKLIPALRAGRKEMLAVGKSAVVMSDMSVKNIEQMEDAFTKMKRDAAANIANKFVGTKEGFAAGISFWDGFLDAMGFGGKPITTPAVTKDMLDKIRAEKAKTNMTPIEGMEGVQVMSPIQVEGRAGFWQKDLPTMNKRLPGGSEFPGLPDWALPQEWDPDTGRAKKFRGFAPGYFPPGSGGSLQTGGLTTGGLSSSGLSGGGGDAYGKIRRGDAARAREAARGTSGGDPMLAAIAENTAKQVEIWGGGGKRK